MAEKVIKPPSRWTGDDLHHWLRNTNPFNGVTHMEVWRWIPDAERWANPNDPTEKPRVLRGYEYVGVCPLPPSPKDIEQALHVYRAVLESPAYLGFSEELRAVFRRMWAKQVGCIHPLNVIKKRRPKEPAHG